MDVKTLCLGVLSRKECSGYEIRKEFEEGAFAQIQEAGFGSIYPALKKLTDEGMAVCIEHPQDGRPDKKVYRITSRGREALFEAVGHDPGPDRLRSDFLFSIMFSDLLPPRQLDRLLVNRIEQHRRTIDLLEGCCGGTAGTDDFVRRYGLAIHQAALDFLEGHRHELVAAQLKRPAPAAAATATAAPAEGTS